MLAGHIGVAIAALGIRRTLPLPLLILASQLPDWTDATLCMAGVRSAVPGMFSHSLPAVVLLAVATAVATFAITRDGPGSGLVALVVLSHLAGDYVTGFKPAWPGGPVLGLGLYEWPAMDFAFESIVITAGWFLYRRSFPAERRSSRQVVAVLVTLLAIQFAADVVFWLSPGIKKC